MSGDWKWSGDWKMMGEVRKHCYVQAFIKFLINPKKCP